MGITITLLVLILLSILISYFADDSSVAGYLLKAFFGRMSFFFAALEMGCVLFIMATHCGTQLNIRSYETQYASLIERVQNIKDDSESDVVKNVVIQDVADWNTSVENLKYFAYNPWTNWFYDKEVVDSMQTIDIDSILESED